MAAGVAALGRAALGRSAALSTVHSGGGSGRLRGGGTGGGISSGVGSGGGTLGGTGSSGGGRTFGGRDCLLSSNTRSLSSSDGSLLGGFDTFSDSAMFSSFHDHLYI
jgi:hypothetical protein